MKTTQASRVRAKLDFEIYCYGFLTLGLAIRFVGINEIKMQLLDRLPHENGREL